MATAKGVIVDKPVCKHRKYVAAGYPIKGSDGRGDIRITSIYHVFCTECGHYVNLLDGSYLDGAGLIHPAILRARNRERGYDG